MSTNHLDYETIALVLEAWEALRRVDDFERVAGVILFKRLFDKAPQAKVLFGYPVEIDHSTHDFQQSKRFLLHASYMIQMIDTSMNMLGPDSELLSEIMMDLGAKHKRYGVQPAMFPIMGECLEYAMAHVLREQFTEAAKMALRETYACLSGDIIKGQKDL